jgi:hypothetical protein
MSLLFQIENCLRLTQLPPSRFGREAVKDPRIVHDLRRGRQPGQRMQERLKAHMARIMAEAQPAPTSGQGGGKRK